MKYVELLIASHFSSLHFPSIQLTHFLVYLSLTIGSLSKRRKQTFDSNPMTCDPFPSHTLLSNVPNTKLCVKTNLQMMSCRVYFSTPFMVTSVRLLPRVRPHVLCQVTLGYKGLLASFFFAPKSVSSMAPSMCLQTIRSWKLLSTPINTTMVYLLCWPLSTKKRKQSLD